MADVKQLEVTPERRRTSPLDQLSSDEYAALGASRQKAKAWRRRGQIAWKIVLQLLLAAGGVLMIVPFIWMLSTSLKPYAQVFAYPPEWIPQPILWSNYVQTVTTIQFGTFYENSLKISALVTLGQLFTCSLAGYTFARLRFPGRNAIFLGYIGTLMIPGQVTMIPVFIVMRTVGLLNTQAAVILPFLASPFGTFLFRQFYLTMPVELEDAAKIDGCSYFGIYRRIFLPLSKPALATVGVFTFLGSWNDFLWPLIMLQDKALMTITVGLAEFRNEMYGTAQWQLMMAGAMISVLPILIVFVLAQRLFVQGIALTGIKG
jgi:multiple sugar transport system permease protein